MLTDAFYATLAVSLKERTEAGDFFIAVGAGDAGWDERWPPPDRRVAALVAEVARREVAAEDVVFLDGSGRPAEGPTPRLAFSVEFQGGEAVGTLRECGLFQGEAGRAAGPDALLSYFRHARIDKAQGSTLVRTVRVDMTPQPVVPGTLETRWLGNTHSEELHDLENTVAACQIDEIRFDHRFYFAGVEEAIAAGYDHCAYCFGRELSTR